MRDVITNTSPVQYLYQLGLLHVLPRLSRSIIAPPAVLDELAAGRATGMDLPGLGSMDWVTVRRPAGQSATPLVTDLGAGETEVLMLGLELPEAVVVLDAARARRVAETLGLRLTGTLGILLDAKSAGMIQAVSPLLDRLQELRFRLAPATPTAVLKLAGESG